MAFPAALLSCFLCADAGHHAFCLLSVFYQAKEDAQFYKEGKGNGKRCDPYPAGQTGLGECGGAIQPYLILAGSGAGKTISLVRPFLQQFIAKGYCGILYDFKNPDLINELNTILVGNEHRISIPWYIVNFRDVGKSHRFNILYPELIRNANYAEEYALSIMSNLDKSILKDPCNFFSRSSVNYLTAIIWFLKKKHPAHCTLPHAINIALYADFRHVLSMLQCDPVAADEVSAVVTSFEQKAERQLAGQLASVQNLLSTINTPEVAWVLSGNDFVPDINAAGDPKLVAVGNDPGMSKSLASVISCIFTVALKNMNMEGKHKSFVLLDEAPTIYLPDLENIAALSRSNRMALVYIAQDLSMMVDMYGKDKTETIIANLSNRFFGKVNLPATARMVAEIIDREEREMLSPSEGLSNSGGRQNISQNYSRHVQERQIFRPEDLGRLKRGEFVGSTTDAGQPYFYGRFEKLSYRSYYKVGPFTAFEDMEHEAKVEDITVCLEDHLKKIKLEAEAIVKSYPNVFAPKGEEEEGKSWVRTGFKQGFGRDPKVLGLRPWLFLMHPAEVLPIAFTGSRGQFFNRYHAGFTFFRS